VGVTISDRADKSVVCVGEAMVEFAPVGDNLYRRGFAGDTLNACWHIAEILGDRRRVGFLTRVGEDPYSSEFIGFIRANGIDATRVSRDAERSMGLYVISLTGAERSFTYWRDTSAARRLADDRDALDEALRDAGWIHVSGITLAVIGIEGRRNLFAALAQARANGALVSFDPNYRPRLWPNVEVFRNASLEMLTVADIALPSFDDEAQTWGDADPKATAMRLGALGVAEIAVKNGSDPVTLAVGGEILTLATPPASVVRDTTGAGDSFNAGYLAGRIAGMAAPAACQLGQAVAREVIGHFGALAPKDALAGVRATIEQALASGR
jgi:2-dehydro-3-deoxygluconokinase